MKRNSVQSHLTELNSMLDAQIHEFRHPIYDDEDGNLSLGKAAAGVGAAGAGYGAYRGHKAIMARGGYKKTGADVKAYGGEKYAQGKAYGGEKYAQGKAYGGEKYAQGKTYTKGAYDKAAAYGKQQYGKASATISAKKLALMKLLKRGK